MTALAGIRVIDYGVGPVTGLATMILADFGAQVLRIEQADHSLEVLPAARMWHRGKELASASEVEIRGLCRCADVFVTNRSRQHLDTAGLNAEQLQADHPHLHYAYAGGFESPQFAHLDAYEHVVAAATGRMMLFSDTTPREGPAFSALQVGVHACAQSLLTGIFAALYQQDQTAGRYIATSMERAMLAYDQGPMIAGQLAEHHPKLAPFTHYNPQAPLPSLYYHPAQTADGRWLQFGNLLPHLFDNFLMATDLIDLVADPDFDPAQLMLPPGKQEQFRARMFRRIQERTSDEWMHDFEAHGGVVAGRYLTTQEAMQDPDIRANGHVVETPEGQQIGPLAKLSATPATPGATRCDAKTWTPRTAPSDTPNTDLPLSGVRVLELATIIAAPMGTSLLADLGAEVIKVEQLGGDPYRGLLHGIGATRVNAGKQSLCLDLKDPQGLQVIHRLIPSIDVLVHNFRPGVPERLGIDYPTLAALNPQLIYLQCNGYGPEGPGAQRPSTHPIPGATMGGVLYQMGYDIPEELLDTDDLTTWARRIMRANEVNPDPNTAMVVASSALLALCARKYAQTGQAVFVDMFGANAYANHDDFLTYPGKPSRSLPDAELHGLNPYYRLYQCADERWVFLAAASERKRKLCRELLGAEAIDFPVRFQTDSSDAWLSTLQDAGVTLVRADDLPPNEYWQAASHEMLGLTQTVTHTSWGTYRRHGAMQVFDQKTAPLRSAPNAGQDNAAILRSLGYSDAEISKLVGAGVLFQSTSA